MKNILNDEESIDLTNANNLIVTRLDSNEIESAKSIIDKKNVFLSVEQKKLSADLPSPIVQLHYNKEIIPAIRTGNLVLITGQAKSCKSTLMRQLQRGFILSTINNETYIDDIGFEYVSIPKGKVNYLVDTEIQGDYGAYLQNKLFRDTLFELKDGKKTGELNCEFQRRFEFCTLSVDIRVAFIDLLTLKFNELEQPFVLFIDGLLDFVLNMNSTEEALVIVQKLKKLAEVKQCTIVCILHTNEGDKSNTKAAGHIGSFATRAFDLVFHVEKQRLDFDSIKIETKQARWINDNISLNTNFESGTYSLTLRSSDKTKKENDLIFEYESKLFENLGKIFNKKEEIKAGELDELLASVYGNKNKATEARKVAVKLNMLVQNNGNKNIKIFTFNKDAKIINKNTLFNE